MLFKYKFLFQTLDPEAHYTREQILTHVRKLGLYESYEVSDQSALAAFLAVLPFLILPMPCPDEMTGNGWIAFLAALKVDRPKGRPPEKYDPIRSALADERLYSPASIAWRAFPDDDKKRNQCRKAHHRYAQYHQFPPGGDRILRVKGKRPAAAWYGWRWKLPPISQ